MAIIAALLAALTVVVTFQVLGRYVPFIPRPLWTEEIARWLLAWVAFLGAAIALRHSDHFVIDLIPQRAEAKLGRFLQLLVLVDRKSTRLNSSHVAISYAGYCWKG